MPAGERWFVSTSATTGGRGPLAEGVAFEGERYHPFPQVAVRLRILEPGIAMSMYHWEPDEEDFLVLAGEALLIVEGEEPPLRQWDFVR